MQSIPNFVFEKTARCDPLFVPHRVRQSALFVQQMRERNRTIDIDHQSARLRAKSSSISSNVITAGGGGGGGPCRFAGVIQPSRMPRSRMDSLSGCLWADWGAFSSTSTRPRSVTCTVSPLAAIRTYSLSLFLSTLRPTVFMDGNVASGSYFVN